MSKNIKFVILSISVLLLSACGGGSSSIDFEEDQPLTPYTSYGSDQNQGRTASTAAGASGDISVVIDDFNELNFELVNGLAAMIIDNVHRSETYTFSCPDGTSAKVSFFENYATGVEQVSATINGQNINCSSTYPTGSFPPVIGSSSSIADLIVNWDVSDAGEYISSNCPDESSANNPFNVILDPDPSICDASLFVDATVIDIDGNTHLVSYESVSIPD